MSIGIAQASGLKGETVSAPGWHEVVHLWTRGTDLKSSPVVYRGKHTDALLIKQEGFIQLTKLSLIRGGKTKTVYVQRAAFDASGMTVDIRHTKSKDGTVIDYYLVRPKHLKHPGQPQTLITAYGVLGVSSEPEYLGGMTHRWPGDEAVV